MSLVDEILQRKPDERGNRMIDYRNCGNPHTVNYTEIDLKWEKGDQSRRIQTAINSLQTGQILKLSSGVWEIEKPIVLSKSHTGLCGSNTTVKANWKTQEPVITVRGQNWKTMKKQRVQIVGNVPVGTRQLTVKDGKDFQVGDSVSVKRFTNWKYIDELDCRQFGWTPKGYALSMDRVVVSKNGNTLILDDDIVVEISDEYGGGELYSYVDDRIRDIYIYNLSITSVYAHDKDENHSYCAIEVDNCKYMSIQNVHATIVQTIVRCMDSTRFITIESCVHENPKSELTGGRRYGFYIDGVNCLVRNCITDEDRHSYVSGSRCCGPNVFYNCLAKREYADSGPHHRHSAGYLYDNVNASISLQHRGPSGTGHGVTAVWCCMWNTGLDKASVVQSYGRTAKNYGIGISAKNGHFFYKKGGQLFAHCTPRGQHVEPISLYMYQLQSL